MEMKKTYVKPVAELFDLQAVERVAVSCTQDSKWSGLNYTEFQNPESIYDCVENGNTDDYYENGAVS